MWLLKRLFTCAFSQLTYLMRCLIRLNNLRVMLEIQTFLQKILQTADVV